MHLAALFLALGTAPGGHHELSLTQDLEQDHGSFRNEWAMFDPPNRFEHGLGPWPVGTSLAQGYFGAFFVDSADISGGSMPPLDPSDDALATMPTLGGGFQYKLGGGRLSFGLETMIDFAGRADALAFYSGSGGALIAVDVDLASLGLGGGPFVSAFLGSRWRVYAAGGAQMLWTWYDQQGSSEADTGDGDGFGTGWYARTGIEYLLPDYATLLGIGGRWSESQVDLSGGFGDIELIGTQVLVTVTRSF